jgi:hypothetical protein
MPRKRMRMRMKTMRMRGWIRMRSLWSSIDLSEVEPR